MVEIRHSNNAEITPPAKIINLAHLPPLAQATAGAIGSAVSNALVYPLDLITTRMQTRPLRSGVARGAETALNRPGMSRKTSVANSEQSCMTNNTTATRSGMSRRRNYKTIRDSFLTILRTEPDGIRAFYHGVLIDTCATMLSSFIYFYVYTSLRKISAAVKRHPGAKLSVGSSLNSIESVLEELSIGSLAGMVCKACTCPLSNITVRIQASKPASCPPPIVMDTPMSECPPSTTGSDSDSDWDDEASDRPRGVLAIMASIKREQGWLGYWSGFSNNCILTLNPSITFYLIKLFLSRKPTLVGTFLGSAIASSCATILTYPLILSKTLVQTNGGKLSAYQILRNRFLLSGGNWKAAVYMGLGGQLAKGFIGQGVTMSVKIQLERLIVYLYAKNRARSP